MDSSEKITETSEKCMKFNFSQASCYLISLNERYDRRNEFNINIKEMSFIDIDFKWVEAIKDENFGGLGCAKSHLIALTDFITKTNDKYCCIFEDDYRFRIQRNESETIISNIIDAINPDVIVLAGTQTIGIPTGIQCGSHSIQKVFQTNSTSGYLIKRNYAYKIINNLLMSINGMEKFSHVEPRSLIYQSFAIDQTWKVYQHHDNWSCTNPMIGFQAPGYSDIEKTEVDYRNNSQ